MLQPDAQDLEHDRLDADRRYNEALTALDRALLHPRDARTAGLPPDTAAPAAPEGWGPYHRLLRAVHGWLAPLLGRQHAFNERVAEELSTSAARERERWQAFEQFETALILFLQQITAYVDTKDRDVAAAASARLDAHDRNLEAVPDLTSRVAVLQRATAMLTRELAPTDTARPITETGPVAGGNRLDQFKYVAFEDQFRGSDEDIREKQRAYLPLFAVTTDVLDLGCGRGEFLALLHAEGISARGVDANHEMAAAARERGLDAIDGDALQYLASLPDGSLGGLMAAQVVEHLEPAYLLRLLDAAYRALRPGSPVVIETINPACWLAFFSSYIRDFTHVRPVHPDTLQYLLRASGFGQVTVRYSAPVPDHMKMKPIEIGADVLASSDSSARALVETATVINRNATILNNLLFSHLDYAVIGYRS